MLPLRNSIQGKRSGAAPLKTMKLEEQAIAGILALIACAGFLWGAIGFAGFALMTALAPGLGTAGASAVTALILLIVAGLIALFSRRKPIAEAETKGADRVLSAIAQIARERPFVAMVGAALLGAGEVLLSRRRKKGG